MLAYSLLKENLGIEGKMISFSKSGYRERKPDNLVVFNSNICVGKTKIWYGDVDLTESAEALKQVAVQSGETLHVLYETDARFEFENDPQLQRAVAIFKPDGTVELREGLRDMFSL